MTLMIQDEDVRRVLTMSHCIDAMEGAFADVGSGAAVNVPRIRYRANSSDPEVIYGSNVHIGAVPRYNVTAVRIGGSSRLAEGAKGMFGTLVNPERSWGFICLISLETGELLAIFQELGIADMRVGATSAMATSYLGREDVTTMGLFGSGTHAAAHIEAMAVVRPLEQVKVFSPTREHRDRFAKEWAERLGIDVVAVEDPREAVAGMDIVCCATNSGYLSPEPVFDGGWLEPGQLVISIQNSDVNFAKSETDEVTLERSSFICINDLESLHSNKQVELLDPIERGVVGWDRVHELGQVVAGGVQVPRTHDDIIYYKNNSGMGVQMAAAGAVAYRLAKEQGLGHEIPTEWFGSLIG